MKILLTGAGGMLGHDLVEALSGHELVTTDVAGDYRRMDITDSEAVLDTIGEVRPDLVIHSAAYTDVDGCSANPDLAFKVNAAGTWNVAAACAEHGAAMVYVSTDFVFDGEKGSPYTEYDTPNPVSAYGASKYAGEVHVRTLVPRHYIVRTAWLYGLHGKSFPRTMVRVAREGKPLRVVADQVGSPTCTVDLAETIRRLIETPLYGTYHVTNSGSCSWHEFAVRTLALAGITGVEVQPIDSDEWPTPTKRPKYSVLRHYSLELQGRDDLRSWEEALADFTARL
ncbi:MAG: dTDP-4-dehydrorhamnose reductase [Armatimonadota bacterium]